MSIAEQLKLQDALERLAALEKRIDELEAAKSSNTLHLKEKADGKRQ